MALPMKYRSTIRLPLAVFRFILTAVAHIFSTVAYTSGHTVLHIPGTRPNSINHNGGTDTGYRGVSDRNVIMKVLILMILFKSFDYFRFSSLGFRVKVAPLFIAMLIPSHTYSNPMEFNTHIGAGDCPGCVIIRADGVIVDETPEKFASHIDGSVALDQDTTVVLNSRGGSLMGGILLGELIRRMGFSTHVGVVRSGTNDDHEISDGLCASACAYAYLGGVRRSMNAESKYGLHQISINSDLALPVGQTVRATQNTIANISNYVESMGASVDIVTVATRTSDHTIAWITSSKQYDFGIVNSNKLVDQSPWTRVANTYAQNWSVKSVLPDGSKGSFILSCASISSLRNGTADVRLIMNQSKQLDASHNLSGGLLSIPVTLYLNGTQAKIESEQLFSFSGPGHSMFGLEIPSNAIRHALEGSGEITLQISYPDSFPNAFTAYDHTIPLNGLREALDSVEASCTRF